MSLFKAIRDFFCQPRPGHCKSCGRNSLEAIDEWPDGCPVCVASIRQRFEPILKPQIHWTHTKPTKPGIYLVRMSTQTPIQVFVLQDASNKDDIWRMNHWIYFSSAPIEIGPLQ